MDSTSNVPEMCRCGILTRPDPYVPASQASAGLSAMQVNGNFTTVEMGQINNLNALKIFPRIVKALKLH